MATLHRPILYGSGDFINDYEGITGYEEFRDDLAVIYFPTFESERGRLLRFELVPLVIHNFCLEAASGTRWKSSGRSWTGRAGPWEPGSRRRKGDA